MVTKEDIIRIARKEKLKSYFYPDFEVLTFKFEELVAEKIRALIQRNKPRDYLDIYYILSKNEIKFGTIIKLAKQKLKSVNDFYDINRIFNNLDLVKTSWEQDLRGLIPNVPNFDEVIKKIRKCFKQ